MPYSRQRKAAKQVMQNLGDGTTQWPPDNACRETTQGFCPHCPYNLTGKTKPNMHKRGEHNT